MKTKYFRDLLVWQRSMQLARDVYAATNSFPKQEVFGLTSQMRRAAVSVPSNIAEGHGRISDKSFRIFLTQARGSLFELETQLQLSTDIGYSQPVAAEKLMQECQEIARMLNGLLNTLKEKEKLASGTLPR
jgi:four helix bundle protein